MEEAAGAAHGCMESVYGVPHGVRVERTLVFVLISQIDRVAMTLCFTLSLWNSG